MLHLAFFAWLYLKMGSDYPTYYPNNWKIHMYLLCFERNIVIISNFFQKLTPCLGNSVCGILQANSKGVTKVPYCNCSLAECPMTWDPYDGKSLTQSTSDQYKVRNHFTTLGYNVLKGFLSMMSSWLMQILQIFEFCSAT